MNSDQEGPNFKALRSKKISFCVEGYFVYPPEFTFPGGSSAGEIFFSNMRPLIRLSDPKISLSKLAEHKNSPLMHLRGSLEDLLLGDNLYRLETQHVPILQAKNFACSFDYQIMRRFNRSRKKITRLIKLGEFGDLEGFIRLEFKNLFDVLRAWRECMGVISLKEFKALESLQKATHRVDEYCSLRVREITVKWVSFLESCQNESIDIAVLKRPIMAAMRSELIYAKSSNFRVVNMQSSKIDIDSFEARRRYLRKFIWSALYLNIRSKPLFRVQKQFGAMIAAAIAAAWAITAEIILILQMAFKGFDVQSFGLSTLIVILSFIGAYVLKDRIKEMGRNRFRRGLWRDIPDHSEKIVYEQDDKKIDIGEIKEYVSSVDFDKLSSDIQSRLILVSNIDKEYFQEFMKIIHYRKFIDLKPKKLRAMPFKFKRVTDIIRYDISPYLGRLDDPEKKYQYVDDEGNVSELNVRKTYSLYVHLQYYKGKDKKKLLGTDCVKVEVEKSGIVNVEHDL